MNKKKIAILTQPLGENYGGMIQNYALQKVLGESGFYSTTINRLANKNLSFITSLKVELVYLLKRISGIPYTKRVRNIVLRENYRFMKTYINLSEELDTTEKLELYFKDNFFDIFIVGSDQTWRPKYSPNIYTYFLDFLRDSENAKKIAYATSFGTDQWEYSKEDEKKCKDLVQNFDAVSVREDSGIKLCMDYLNVNAQVVLDPTLLLDEHDYSQLIKLPKSNKGLFTYILDKTTEKENFIKACGNKMNLKRYTNQAKEDIYSTDSRDINDFIIPSIEGWLQGFRDADFVITDSFHGMVFSIINRKKFIVIVNQNRGASRFTSLLNQLDLMDCLVSDIPRFDECLLNQTIDYSLVFKKLNVLRADSLKFLKENLA